MYKHSAISPPRTPRVQLRDIIRGQSLGLYLGMNLLRSLLQILVMARCVRSFRLIVSTHQTKIRPFGSGWRLYSSSVAPADDDSKKRVVFLGTPEVAATTLKTLYEDSSKEDSNYSIVAVITQPPKRQNRGKKMKLSPVGQLAEELGINMLTPEKVFIFAV